MKLTQEKLAEKMSVSKSAIAKWETDGGIPDRENFKRLADVLNVTVDELYRIADDETDSGKDFRVNITSDVITLLESYGYTVIEPRSNKED